MTVVHRITPSREQEDRQIQAVRDWFACLADLIELTTDGTWGEHTASPEIPDWVRSVARLLRGTLFAPATIALDDLTLTAYRAGYAMGLMRWGDGKVSTPLPPEIVRSFRRIRLSPRANRAVGRIFESFLLRGGFLTRADLHRSRYIPPDFKSRAAKLERESISNAAEFHRGMADGLRGVGSGAPNDRSTLATEIYFALIIWWRVVARMRTATELHTWLLRILGPKVRDRERVQKICQRIGLKFRNRGRPRKNPTPALPG